MKRNKFTTLITETRDYSKRALAMYRKLGPVYLWPELSKSEQKRRLRDANILVLMLKYQIDKKWIDAMPNLRIVATQTTGLNHIDTEYLKEKKIKLLSLQGQKGFLKNIPSTAELAMGLLLALVRNTPRAVEDVKKGNWNRTKLRGRQLHKKTLGIVGYGRLGTIMGRYGKAFGMNVIAYDPHVPAGTMKQNSVQKVKMNELFKQADYVSVHVILNKETKNLIKEKHLKKMKPSSCVINTARAELIERDALYHALKNKWLKGVAIDVMWNEMSSGAHLKKDPLWTYAKNHDNLIIVPHIGGATFEAMEITQEFLAGLVTKQLRTHT